MQSYQVEMYGQDLPCLRLKSCIDQPFSSVKFPKQVYAQRVSKAEEWFFIHWGFDPSQNALPVISTNSAWGFLYLFSHSCQLLELFSFVIFVV